MTTYVFPPVVPALPVLGTDRAFPVRRIWCVGSNYRKPGVDYAARTPPYFFSKQPDMLVPDGGTIPFAPDAGEMRYEVELVVAMGSRADSVDENAAASHIFGYAVGLDMTRRDLLLQAQQSGKPWDIGKSFEGSAPVGTITPASGAWLSAGLRLSHNGVVRQDSNIDQMIWTVPEVIAHLSRQVVLRAGDLIFTGTPAGHAACAAGDAISASVDGLQSLTVSVG